MLGDISFVLGGARGHKKARVSRSPQRQSVNYAEECARRHLINGGHLRRDREMTG